MKHSPQAPLILVGCALGASAAFQATSPPPAFIPGAGVEATRTYTWQETSETSSVEVLLGGEASDQVPLVSSEQSSEASLTLSDVYTRSAVNQPLELRRTFDDISFEAEGELTLEGMGGGAATLAIACDSDCELDGVAVEFTWDADAEVYRVRYAEDYEGVDELLEPLRPDADFLELLPEPDEDIEVGESWSVDPSALASVLLPGGRAPIVKESDMAGVEGAPDPLLMPGVLDTLDGDAAGEIQVRLAGVQDGIMTLEVTVDAQFESRKGDDVTELLGGAAPPDVKLELRRADFASTLEGKGVLRWNIERNLPESIQLDLETELSIELEVFVGGMGIDALFELNEERAGTLAFTMARDEE